MIDRSTPKGRILGAALECAAAGDWAKVTLLDIAEAAKVPMAEMREHFPSKTAIVSALLRAVDGEVLARVQRAEGQAKRDVLFDVIMTRFDVLEPYKAALKSIYNSGPADLSLVGALLSSQHWMLQAAGIGTEGPGGALRVAGLAGTYASVFRVWLSDDDPGHARTMAALDRRLRRGERAVRTADGIASTLRRAAEDAPGYLRSMMKRRGTSHAASGPAGPTPDPGPAEPSNS